MWRPQPLGVETPTLECGDPNLWVWRPQPLASPHTGNSAKSLAHSSTDNSAKSLAQHCPQTDNSAKSLAHCPHTGNSAKSLAQANLPNHWHAPQYTGNSAKSLACSSMIFRQFLCQTDRQFCQCTGTSILPTAKSLARSSTYRQFCQITGTQLKESNTNTNTLQIIYHITDY